jgi:beta-phosphoglucomutase-like phosphatase (HAD superfamily)
MGLSPLELAFLFDVDGVIMETPHEQAWHDSSLEWNIIGYEYNFTPFYAHHVARKPALPALSQYGGI